MNKQLQTLFIIGGIALVLLMYAKSKKTNDEGLDKGINGSKDNESREGNPLPSNDSFDRPLQACTPAEEIFQKLLAEEEERLRETTPMTKETAEIKAKGITINRKNELLALSRELYNDCRKRLNLMINDFKDNGVDAPSTAENFLRKNNE